MAWDAYVGMGLGAIGTGLGVWNAVKARERFSGSATLLLENFESGSFCYIVSVTNTGNMPLVIREAYAWSSVAPDQRRRIFDFAARGAKSTVEPHEVLKLDFAERVEAQQPDTVEVVPHKGKPFRAVIDRDKARQTAFTHIFVDFLLAQQEDFDFYLSSTSPDRIWVTGFDVELDVGAIFRGSDELWCTDNVDLWQQLTALAQQDTFVSQFSRSRPEGGSPKYCLGLNEFGMRAVQNPYEVAKQLNRSRALDYSWR